jgi:hypothetical protein
MTTETFTDRNGHTIEVGKHMLMSQYGDRFYVVDDVVLGISILNVRTGTLEKLTGDIASELLIAAIIVETIGGGT